MPKAGDNYTVELKDTHLSWGEHRHTNSRPNIEGEGFLPIPAEVAKSLKIHNSVHFDNKDIEGGNLFNCKSTDGHFSGILKAQGNREKGCGFAKNFSEKNNLKGIGNWLEKCQAKAGDSVKVEWKSPTDVVITHIPK